MHSEKFYKIGGALQFLTAVFLLFQRYDILVFSELEQWNLFTEIVFVEYLEIAQGSYYGYTLFLFNASFMNLLIGRSGMPLGQYQSFILINIATWLIATIISLIYFSLIIQIFHVLILFAFIAAFFIKPKFQ